jgi:endonuclease YncB( thermonuclease family)
MMAIACAAILALVQPSPAQSPAPNAPSFAIPQTGVSFATGDTWVQNGQRMRLYGVQSCLRGTSFTNAAGLKTDCGEASLAYLAAIVRDTRPSCTPIAQIAEPQSIIVVCKAHVGDSTLDLGTVLITQGFAFAAFNDQAEPVYMPYLVAQMLAKKQSAGLWAAADLPYPNAILLGAIGAVPRQPPK